MVLLIFIISLKFPCNSLSKISKDLIWFVYFIKITLKHKNPKKLKKRWNKVLKCKYILNNWIIKFNSIKNI